MKDIFRRKLKVFGVIGGILLAFSLGYRLGNNTQTPSHRSIKNPCDLHQQACKINLDNGHEVELSISPKNIPSDKPIHITATFTGFTPEQTYLSLTTLTQKSGFSRLPLEAQEKNRFSTDLKLIEFGGANQEWLLLLKFVSEQKTISIPFKFQADS